MDDQGVIVDLVDNIIHVFFGLQFSNRKELIEFEMWNTQRGIAEHGMT